MGQLSEEELAQHGSAELLASSYGISGLVYILGLESEHDADELMQAITSIAPNKKEAIMTAAAQLRQQGMQQEKLGIARNMLNTLHLGIDMVEKATGLSRQELERLQANETNKK